jgi:hypothetical protein
MKINDVGGIRNRDLKKTRKNQAGSAEAFSAMLSAELADTPTLAGVAPAHPVGLTGLQEVDSDEHKARKQHAERGKNMLEVLDTIRHGLLLGTLSPAALRNVQQLLHNKPPELQDPRLIQIIQEIEVRAAVELAKLENSL